MRRRRGAGAAAELALQRTAGCQRLSTPYSPWPAIPGARARRRGGTTVAGGAWAADAPAASVAAGSGSRPIGRSGTPVCAACSGPVRAAADTASPLDCPRCWLGCLATASGPPRGGLCGGARRVRWVAPPARRETPHTREAQHAARAEATQGPTGLHPTLAPKIRLWIVLAEQFARGGGLPHDGSGIR